MICPNCKSSNIFIEDKIIFCEDCKVSIESTSIPLVKIARIIFNYRKKYIRNSGKQKSFTVEEISKIWEIRHLSSKDAIKYFPGRNIRTIDYLRQKTGAYRIFSKGGISEI